VSVLEQVPCRSHAGELGAVASAAKPGAAGRDQRWSGRERGEAGRAGRDRRWRVASAAKPARGSRPEDGIERTVAELKLGYKASAEQSHRASSSTGRSAKLTAWTAPASATLPAWRHKAGMPFSLAWMTAVGERTKGSSWYSVLTPTSGTTRRHCAGLPPWVSLPDRIFLGVDRESLNEIATGYEGECRTSKSAMPAARIGAADARAVRRPVDSREYTHQAPPFTTFRGGIPIYIAAGGPQVAKYAGRAGDGFICTPAR